MPRIVSAAVLALAIPALPSFAQSVATDCPDGVNASGCVAAGAPGRIVYLDPETGEILTGEAAAEASQEAARSTFVEALSDQVRQSFSTEGLSEERTETGAVALDLEGRFQNPLVATIGKDGSMTVEHFSLPAAD